MEKGILKDLLEDIIELARNGETEEIIAICESEIKELDDNAANDNI